MKCISNCGGDVDTTSPHLMPAIIKGKGFKILTTYACKVCRRLHTEDGLGINRKSGARAYVSNEGRVIYKNIEGEIVR